jgi:penicillin amidase
MAIRLANADAPFDIVWDTQGIPHVYATTTADAFRGMGYAAGRERLWQIHQSTAYANCEAAALLGERFVAQDAIQRACNVHGLDTGLPDSDGDWIVDAYLDGLNTVVDQLDEYPPEFAHAGTTPRRFTRTDIAARYRFTSWFQHKSWTEKMAIGRLMATHGIDWFKHHLLHFSDADAEAIETLKAPLSALSTQPYILAYPEASHVLQSGSNNWAITGALSASGKPILATDPHQPHTIPNTFFYVHLHAPDLDVFGAGFPGVPYFMMGTTRNIAWGLTTGFIDCYDVYLERLNNQGQYQFENDWHDLAQKTESIQVRDGSVREISIARSRHGPLLEPLCRNLGLDVPAPTEYAAALHWSLTDIPTSAGALARLPLAKNAGEFGSYLFENDVCPLVNNIICVDANNGLRRFIAATLPAREAVTGSVPLPGWSNRYEFPVSTEQDLTVEIDPDRQFSLTANNDTMGENGPFYIHTFPANSARANRITEILEEGSEFTVADFKAAQLDLKDLRALEILPDLLAALAESDDAQVAVAHTLLSSWDGRASADQAAPCLFYPFQDRLWARKFIRAVIVDDPVIATIPTATPGLNLFDIKHFLAKGSPWSKYHDKLCATIHDTMASVVAAVTESLGPDPAQWRWGDLHQILFSHRLAKHESWRDMRAGPDPIGGSGTTLGMAMHMGPGPGSAKSGEIPCRVYHGPAFRLVADLADPNHVEFVIAGGNGGVAGSTHATDQYPKWLRGEYNTVSFLREELDVEHVWRLTP